MKSRTPDFKLRSRMALCLGPALMCHIQDSIWRCNFTSHRSHCSPQSLTTSKSATKIAQGKCYISIQSNIPVTLPFSPACRSFATRKIHSCPLIEALALHSCKILVLHSDGKPGAQDSLLNMLQSIMVLRGGILAAAQARIPAGLPRRTTSIFQSERASRCRRQFDSLCASPLSDGRSGTNL